MICALEAPLESGAIMKTQHLTRLAIYTAMALALNLFERMIPLPIPFPGVKLGLANLIIVIVLYKHSFKDALTVNIARVLLAAIFGGGLSALLYSFSGALISLVAMFLVMQLMRSSVSSLGVSLTGAYFHSFAQIGVAAVIIENVGIVTYLPVIMWASLATGAIIGIVSGEFLKRELAF